MSADRIKDYLRHAYHALPLARAGFARPLAVCAMADCRGLCCYDGVYLDAPTEAAIAALVDERRADFAAMGLDLPDDVVVSGEGNRRKTATKAWDGPVSVPDYPQAFNRTACVFHLDDGRCGFQVLAGADGLHPWAYKPHACWLFPISISRGAIAVHDDRVHPSASPAYNDFVVTTKCGRTQPDGRPAVEALAEELRYLGQILGRDLIAEVTLPPEQAHSTLDPSNPTEETAP